jgi:hypothetical protein
MMTLELALALSAVGCWMFAAGLVGLPARRVQAILCWLGTALMLALAVLLVLD